MRVAFGLLLVACSAKPVAQVASTPTPPAAETKELQLRAQWLDVPSLQGSGVAVVGEELYVAGDRSSADKNTIVVFPRVAGQSSAIRPLRKIVLDVEHDEIRDPFKRKLYDTRICSDSACEPLDVEDLAVDAAGNIYVSVEGERDAVIKFDGKSHRAVDLWEHATGDVGGMGAEGLAVSPDGILLFVGRQNPPILSITNVKTGWSSRGPINVDQINGLAYDPSSQHLLVLDGSVGEIVRVSLIPGILSRHHARRFWVLASFSLRSGAHVSAYVPLRSSRKPRQNVKLAGRAFLRVWAWGVPRRGSARALPAGRARQRGSRRA